jgi:hypothetical protein
MADDVSLPAITGTVAADDIDGKLHQRMKISIGDDGAAVDCSASNPLPISDAGGSVTVDGTVAVSGSIPVTNAGTFATQVDGAALTALQLLDNIVAVEDAVAGSGYGGVPLLVVRQDSQSDLAADGDFISPTVDADGGLRVSIIAGGGSGGTAQADDAAFTPGTTSITPVGGTYRSVRDSVNDNDAGAFAMTALRAPLVVLETPLGDSVIDDTLDAVKVSIVGDSVGSSVDTDDGTVNGGQSDIALVITEEYQFDGTNWVRPLGNAVVAHDQADAGNPIKIGLVAETSISGRTLVADGDRTDLFAGVDGVIIMRQHCNLEDNLTGTLTNTDGASTAVLAAQGAGIKSYLTMLDLYNSSSSGVVVELKDGATAKKTFYVPATGGLIRKFEPPLAGTANTAWNIDAAGATTTLYANVEGFKSKI